MGTPKDDDYLLYRPVWDPVYAEHVEITHKEPEDFSSKCAYYTIRTVRVLFDIVSGYAFGKVTGRKIIRRIVFLESIAGVPGMVAAMIRHLHSLRRMKRDNGWIHTLLEEAENERMHLLIALYVGSVFGLY